MVLAAAELSPLNWKKGLRITSISGSIKRTQKGGIEEDLPCHSVRDQDRRGIKNHTKVRKDKPSREGGRDTSSRGKGNSLEAEEQ